MYVVSILLSVTDSSIDSEVALELARSCTRMIQPVQEYVLRKMKMILIHHLKIQRFFTIVYGSQTWPIFFCLKVVKGIYINNLNA